MNIAEIIKSHYDSGDFEQNYSQVLFESFHNNKGDIVARILDKFNVSNYETQDKLTNWKAIDRKQAELIFDFISDNFEEFERKFSGYYVGYTSLESVSFGEQEEQLTGIYNRKTKKPYKVEYLQKVFSDAGYYVNGDYAYYNIDAGLHIDLLASIEPLNNFLTTI